MSGKTELFTTDGNINKKFKPPTDIKEQAKLFSDLLKEYIHEYQTGWKNSPLHFCWKYEFKGNDYMWYGVRWEFGYKTLDDCPVCDKMGRILDAIFGSRYTFNRLPFVKAEVNNYYEFSLDLLECFIEHGEEKVKERITEIEELKNEKKRRWREKEENREKREATRRLNQLLDGRHVGEELKQYLIGYIKQIKRRNAGDVYLIKIIDHDIALFKSGWLEHRFGFISYSEVVAYYKGKTQGKEWHGMLEFHGHKLDFDQVGKVEINTLEGVPVATQGNRPFLRAELVNSRRETRRLETFSFV